MSNWKLKTNGNEYDIDYRTYHLTDGKRDYAVHEINYNGKSFIGKTLEEVATLFGKSLEEKNE